MRELGFAALIFLGILVICGIIIGLCYLAVMWSASIGAWAYVICLSPIAGAIFYMIYNDVRNGSL